jgi:membrane-bound lytic murein transglycosylase A
MRGRWFTALVIFLASCAVEKPPPGWIATTFDALPGWREDRLSDAAVALQRSCSRLATLRVESRMAPSLFGAASDWQKACAALRHAGPDEIALRRTIESHFRPFALRQGSENFEGLFTGYYEPILRGSRMRDARHATPIHAVPDDLVTADLQAFRESFKGERVVGRVAEGRFVPYHDRAAIESGVLGARARVLVWVDDPIDVFFLHIQGSGRVRLAEGGEMRVGYAAQNGHPYFAIGRALVERGVLTREGVSMQSIRAWLAANPLEASAVMQLNRSYIFFSDLGSEGPIGSEGTVLTPGRSLAVDRTHIMLGAPIWIDVEHPRPGEKRLQRLMVAQDTGGAIRGPVRGDFFWGAGEEAGDLAGRMRSRGRWWILMPVGLPAP